MKKIALWFFMLMSICTVLWAENINFEATVNSNRVSLDEVMQLTLTLTGVNDNLDPVSLPVIDGFSAKYLGPSTSVSIVNGVYHSEKSFIYDLFPNKVGHFQVPAISATISGHTYSTNPIDLEVVANAPQAQAAASPDQSQAPNNESLKDKLLVKVAVDNTDVYLDQRIGVAITFLIKDVQIRDIQFPPQFDKTGFMVDEFDKPQQSSQVINGVRYDTVEFKTKIYPNRLGDLTFGPVQVQGNVLYKTRSAAPFDQGSNPFGEDVFNNFFDSYAARPVTISSDPIQFHVSSLPQEGRPQDFSGAIGQLGFKANVTPVQVKAGDPLTLKMDIKGDGNFKSFKMPVFKSEGFKVYEPKIKDTTDEKTAEIVIIPTSANIKEVPSLDFSYFDTSLKAYRTITEGPFPIQVVAPSADQDFKAVGFADISHQTTISGADQFPWGKMVRKLQRLVKNLCGSFLFWSILGAALIGGGAFFIWRQFQERLLHDPAFARRLKAAKEAKQALKLTEEYLPTGKSKEFYALLSKVLRDYLANKWHQSSAALNTEDILIRLKKVKMDESIISQLKDLLEQADLVCFAGADRDRSQMKADLLQAQNLINKFEKILLA